MVCSGHRVQALYNQPQAISAAFSNLIFVANTGNGKVRKLEQNGVNDSVCDRCYFSGWHWSKTSAIYHFSTCKVVKNIKEANLQTGNTPPAAKTLHQ